MTPGPDFIIVGQGLAGSVLALNLIEAGAKVEVFDCQLLGRSSSVSQGLVNSISGLRLNIPWAWEPAAFESLQFFTGFEQVVSKKLIKKRNCIRLFRSLNQKAIFEKNCLNRVYQKLVKKVSSPGEIIDIEDNFGSFTTQTYQVDVKAFLCCVKHILIEKQAYRKEKFDYSSVSIDKETVS